MKVGDMVQSISGTVKHGRVGIVTLVIEPYDHNLWPSDNLVEVMYSLDEYSTWSHRSLEIVNESR